MMIQMLPWLLAIAVALERLIHHRSRGSGARWYVIAFVLCSAGAMVFLVFSPPQSLPLRIVLGTAAVITAVTGGAYLFSMEAAGASGNTTDLPASGPILRINGRES
jgi:bacteriorhodopsin